MIVEIDVPEFSTTWRKKVVAARKEAEGEEIPSPDCEDLEEWDIEICELEDLILWDADYDDENLFIDDLPERSNELKKLVGISKNYYVTVADDLNEEEIAKKLSELSKLCCSVVKKSSK